ncbi:MAG: hypothetical protein CMI29_03445 [Opitutae bacterium]|nr:hypothetical protein [Opitutae bacterium]|tara:strand:- start:17503 stop:18513 length:1011 start_codon:yes stop_codon:yes gene_type:complete
MISGFFTKEGSMLWKFTFLILLVSVPLLGSDFPTLKSGEAFGILSSKATAWIEVKEDEGFTHRYLSPWRGGSPTNGGGFDPKMMDKIGEIVVGNRIWISWYWDGHLRLKKIRMIRPRKHTGVFAGYLLDKGENWFDALTQREKIPWRFYVRWSGGLPEHGGGYDTESLDFLNDADPNLPIRFSWSYDFRPRFEKFIEEAEEEEKFVPFYEGRTLKKSTPSPTHSSPIVNPFDQVPQANPFDQARPANPFDSAPKSPSPFDQAPQASPFDSLNPPLNPFDGPASAKALENPFDSQVKEGTQKPVDGNPFDSPPPPKNPFEDSPLPGNPFESLDKAEP